MEQFRVLFAPFDRAVAVEAGTTLLEAAGKAGMALESPCGGDGICGRCKLIVKEGAVGGGATGLLLRDEVRQGVVLACQTTVESDLLIEIPEKSRAKERIAIDPDAQRFRADHPGVVSRAFKKDPLVTKVFLALDPPTLADNTSDLERIQTRAEKLTGIRSMQTGLKVIQQVPGILRANDYRVTATIGRRRDIAEIMAVEGGDTSGRNAIAVVDVGTTTIVAHLVDANSGATLATQACFNGQATYGREVTARMIASERSGAAKLQELVVEDINRLIASLTAENGIPLGDITAVVCAGNTAMMHFLLGLPTRHIRRSPFVAAAYEPPPLRAAEVGIKINPRGLLFTIPGVGGWVGGDVTAGLLATGLGESDETGMFVDVGTNGEIVVGNRDWLMACSASAGPGLEGAGVACGMMAESGAIEEVYVADGELRYHVIGGGSPDGICGSGVIDAIASLLDLGVINRGGQLIQDDDPSVRFGDDGLGRYILADARRGSERREVYICQDDINNVMRVKASIFAAAKILLDRVGLGFSDIKKLYLAGGFGSHINLQNAIAIGLLPDLPIPSIQYVGNTSIWGAKLAALSTEAFDAAREIAERTTCYDLMGAPDYVEQFRQALFLPHTNIELFPSQAERERA